MITNFKQFNENMLVPRNIEGRKEKRKQMNIKLLSQEVINGDLDLDESFMNVDPKFVKLKKVNGYVWLNGGQWTEIPVWLKDVEITGTFVCSNNILITLKNCPQKIRRSFYCYYNRLTSLEGCPEIIGSTFNCSGNKLISLDGCSKEIGGDFDCTYNQLTSLENCPKNIEGDFACHNNTVKLELPKNIKLKGEFYN